MRLQGSGQNGYLGIYYWNSGSPQLRLYERNAGSCTQLGSCYSVGPLAAGTQLEVTAAGSTISFLENGVPRISVTDSTFTGGAPGIMAHGNAAADNWSGGQTPRAYPVGGECFGACPGRWCCRITAVMICQRQRERVVHVHDPGGRRLGLPVTVKTNPSGQSCTVSNGSGTVGSAQRHRCRGVLHRLFATSASDGFNRADGGLGPNWTAISDGGMAIASQAVTGTVGAITGDIRTADSFTSDQYSQVEVTSTQLSGGQWVGPAVRVQNSGQNGYLGIYYWNSGSPQLRLYKRNAGSWTQLGSSYSVGPLAAGTQLELAASGSTISFLVDGAPRISVTDSTFTGGAPGIMAFGSATADNWSGGETPRLIRSAGRCRGCRGRWCCRITAVMTCTSARTGRSRSRPRWPSGSGYAVTVKTNPSGQSCTVSNGSGTVGSANVTDVAVSCSAGATSASDGFNRADGGLGANWAAISDGGMAIASQVVTGTAGAITGDTWAADSFTSDQYSQVEVTSTQLSGGQWVGPAVRVQNNGQNGYLGIYYWNSGSPQLRLYKRSSGNWTQLGSSYSVGPLAAGTQLELAASGSTVSFLVGGAPRISVTDSSFTGGAPGMMAFGSATADNWSGGNAVSYPVGGAVSGLSGTVVLQDNGGDDLSVSANGSFTFATPVASGSGYAVTVKTNPSGQSCTVSNGSGTVGSANVTDVAVSCSAGASVTASDDFNRADGGLGANWAAISDGGMAIASQVVTGTAGATTGDTWAAIRLPVISTRRWR